MGRQRTSSYSRTYEKQQVKLLRLNGQDKPLRFVLFFTLTKLLPVILKAVVCRCVGGQIADFSETCLRSLVKMRRVIYNKHIMKINNEWKDYSVIATGDGEKLERWKNFVLIRPDPQVIWHASKPLTSFTSVDARYVRSETGGGHWEYFRRLPESWNVSWRTLTFSVKPMGFKHTGLFPEQAVNWATMIDLIGNASRPVSVLNLFAYTGGATVACAYAGASVCHVDAAKNMVDRAKENMALSGLADRPVRYIVDDCRKFVKREINRGRKYDAVIMDPPSYGRGANGEVWKIEQDIADFVQLCEGVLSDNPLFVLINSYTTGLQPAVLKNILNRCLGRKGDTQAYEVCLPTEEEGIVLPCGASALFTGAK